MTEEAQAPDALPLVVDADQLQPLLGHPGLVLIDMSRASTYAQLHLPGAVHMDYAAIVASRPPAHGLLPEPDLLERVLGQHGIGNELQVVVYDDEGGGKAARLIWTLHCLGHWQASLLDGGITAWYEQRRPMEHHPARPHPTLFQASPDPSPVADRDYILSRLQDEDLRLLDARSAEEYLGQRRYSERGGHIPGAQHLDWLALMDRSNHLRLQPQQILRDMLQECGIRHDHEVICYCQTHHRSSLTYVTLRWLGYDRVRGYPGSWSEWGNRSDTPVEQPA